VGAEERLREALARFREIGDVSSVAFSLNNVGYTLLEQGKYEEAAPLLEESLALSRRIGLKDTLAHVLDSLGFVARVQGKLERAEALLSEGLAVSRELEDIPQLLFILGHMADLAVERGQHGRAIRLAGSAAAARAARGIPNPPIEQERLESAMNRARDQVGKEKFQAAWAEGQNMSIADSVTFALDYS
jgi:tetratricopeptide (TPR) repeat protein